MPHYNYLIVGGGMTADSAIHGIQEIDKEGSIAMFGSDANLPYDRPPLTKALWKGEDEGSIWRDTAQQNVEIHQGRTIRSIDPEGKKAVDDQGAEYTFDKLLLATGVSPRRLDFGGEGILYYRTFEDYKKLRQLTETGQAFLLIGGGFIGSELAAALAMNGKKAAIAFPGEGIGSSIFPAELSLFLNDYYREKGVGVLPKSHVFQCEARQNKYWVSIKDDSGEREIEVDAVIAGIGTVPNVELASLAGLEVDNGIRVNASLQTSHPSIYAAGDVALFHDPSLDEWRRVEHEDNANSMGKAAGRIMAGAQETYTHLPFFYSDLFDLGYEAVGDLDSRLETFCDWKEPFKEGVIYYLRDGQVRGVLLWNVWEQVEAARKLIQEEGPFTAENLKGRLPEGN